MLKQKRTQSSRIMHRYALLAASVGVVVALAAPSWSAAPEVKPASSDDRSAGPSSGSRRIAGLVLGPDGSPVAGAEVYLFASDYWHPAFSNELEPSARPVEQYMRYYVGHQRKKMLRRTRTDAAGRFTMELDRPGPAWWPPKLAVVAEGLGLVWQNLPEKAGNLRISVPEMVPIRGRLLTPGGTPAEGVLVWVGAILRDSRDFVNVCQCRFDFSHGQVPYPDAASATPLRQGDRQLRQLEAAREWIPEFWPPPLLTDAEGRFTLTGMPMGRRVLVTFIHPEFAPETIAVRTSPTRIRERRPGEAPSVPPTFTHTLSPSCPVEGTITAADTGKPVSGVLVEIQQSWGGGGRTFYGRTDERGRYRVNCPIESHYAISVYPSADSGYLTAEAIHSDRPEDKNSIVKDFRLGRGRIVRGRVLDAETDKPIRGASVMYHPSPLNFYQKGPYGYANPVLTDADGRFTLTGLKGPGYVSAEAPDRSYVRSPPTSRRMRANLGRALPMGLTSVHVPVIGVRKKEVVIRLRRGRTVVLQVVGPKGEKLPSVDALWNGIHAVHDRISHLPHSFPEGKVVVSGLDGNRPTRVFLIFKPRKLGAVFDISPDMGEDTIEVRLQPTATLAGRIVSPDGEFPEDAMAALILSFDPELSRFTESRLLRAIDLRYEFLLGQSGPRPPYPGGRFMIENVMPGARLGLAFGLSGHDWQDIITLEPLKPGEQRDVGDLVVPVEQKSSTECMKE